MKSYELLITDLFTVVIFITLICPCRVICPMQCLICHYKPLSQAGRCIWGCSSRHKYFHLHLGCAIKPGLHQTPICSKRDKHVTESLFKGKMTDGETICTGAHMAYAASPLQNVGSFYLVGLLTTCSSADSFMYPLREEFVT